MTRKYTKFSVFPINIVVSIIQLSYFEHCKTFLAIRPLNAREFNQAIMPSVPKSYYMALSSQYTALYYWGKHTLQKESINREKVTCTESPNKQIAKLSPRSNIRVKLSLLCFHSIHLYNSSYLRYYQVAFVPSPLHSTVWTLPFYLGI